MSYLTPTANVLCYDALCALYLKLSFVKEEFDFKVILKFYFFNMENCCLMIFSVLDFWIAKRNSKLCEVTKYNDGHMSKIFPQSCTLKYPSMCVKHFKIESEYC